MADKKSMALERVIDLTGQMIVEMQFSEISVAEIAARARCSTATIYEVYGNKENLFIDALGQMLLNWAPPTPTVESEGPFAGILTYTWARIKYCSHRRTRGLLRAMRERSDRGALLASRLMELRGNFGMLINIVEGAFDEGLLRRTDAESVAYCVVANSVYEALSIGNFFGADAEVDAPAIIRKIFTPLVTEEGAARLAVFLKSVQDEKSNDCQHLPLAAHHLGQYDDRECKVLVHSTLIDLGVPSPYMGLPLSH